MYYVIQVETGKENKTIKEMNERLSSAFSFEAFTPLYEANKKMHGEYIRVTKPYFPGYVFVETDNPQELFKGLYYVPGFTKLLGREGLTDLFIPLLEHEERMIDILCSKHSDRVTRLSSASIKPGMNVIILDGPLLGYESLIKKVNLHKRTVTISLSIGGIYSDVELGIDLVSESK